MALRETRLAKLDLLGFDACLMQMAEIAYYLKNYVNYMVGAEESTWGRYDQSSWPWQYVLADLNVHPSSGARELGEMIVRRYCYA